MKLFKLLVELLKSDIDIPHTMLSPRYADRLRTIIKTIIYFFTLATTGLKTISFIAKICLTILNSVL